MSKFEFRNKLVVGLTVSCAMLLLVAALTYSTLARNTLDRQGITHTVLVLEKLSDLQSQIADAETGQRGFLLTADTAYLDPYEKSLSTIPATILTVRQLTADNPTQQNNLVRLDSHLKARFAVLHEVIETRKRDGLSAAQATVSNFPGRLRMDAIRFDVSDMKDEENRRLQLLTGEMDLTTRRAKLYIFFGAALGFCFLFLAGAVIRQEMDQRRRSDEEIRRLNADLELRVTQRTFELAARSHELERSNTELQQFAYVASHDLQEPLRTISSFSQLLAKRYRNQLDDKAREFIDFTVDGCKRMQTLINDLLTFSRVGTDLKPLAPVRCDVALDRALKNLRLAIQESGTEIQRSPLPVVMADEVQLAQLFQNLVSNAIKFRGPLPPRINIFAQRQDRSWLVRVRDNGIGILPEHSDRIFVIFQRLHTSAQYSGTGIGLAVCKKIAERHGGAISVQPSPEGGSIFSFTMSAGEIKNAGSTEEKTPSELRRNAAAY
jgi:signal transduction histidine kinase